jgi:hypothetical protein
MHGGLPLTTMDYTLKCILHYVLKGMRGIHKSIGRNRKFRGRDHFWLLAEDRMLEVLVGRGSPRLSRVSSRCLELRESGSTGNAR